MSESGLRDGVHAESGLAGGHSAMLVADVGQQTAAAIDEARVIGRLEQLDRGARRQKRTLPTEQERQALRDEFWQRLIPVLARLDGVLAGQELAYMRQQVQSLLNPWLLRGRLWAPSWLTPHGFAGDYRMVEWMSGE